MILKGKERGDGPQLAQYLLTLRDNDHVELHEVRGFVSNDLAGAFAEADAIAAGTRCKNHLFSMSLNPPEGAEAGTQCFEDAVDRIEKKLGLDGQPRAIVFHEKDGRRHAHAVWSRIDSVRMRALNLSNYKLKLRDVSRKLYLEHGWDMPRGLQDRRLRDPLNFSRQDWQQAKRTGVDPREIKTAMRQCWESSDDKASFQQALKERGFWLARGDRRGYVAIDYRGEVYSLSRYAGVKSKDLAARLGEAKELPSVDRTKADIADRMTHKLAAFIKDVERDARQRQAVLDFRKAELTSRHQQEREALREAQEQRWNAEAIMRAQRLPKGFSGVWHRLTGQYGRIRAQNEREAYDALRRDHAEKDAVIVNQLEDREVLQRDIKAQRSAASDELIRLRREVASYRRLDRDERETGRHNERDRKGDTELRRRSREQLSRRRRGFEP